MKSIGFAGTAKNTGKTTAVLSIMEQCRTTYQTLALTSIGFDGEQRDTITGLPKPRYCLHPGDRVATASECLAAGSAEFKILHSTDLKTILGNIVIAEVTKEGTALVAGPNRQRDLETLMRCLIEMDTHLLLVDGALNRLAPMIACDGLVLSTGAAYSNEIPKIIRHAVQLVDLFRLPVEPTASQVIHGGCLVFEDESIMNLRSGSLLEEPEIRFSHHARLNKIILTGAVNPKVLQCWVSDQSKKEKLTLPLTVVVGSPLKIIASGHLEEWRSLLQSSELNLKVQRSLPLLAVTTCPFYPRWLQHGGEYEPASVDPLELLSALKNVVTRTPVFDIVQDPAPDWCKILHLERN